MTDFLDNDESGKTVRERIFHSPQTFDTRVFLDRKFASKIAGWSTFSLSRVAKDLSSRHVSMQPHSSWGFVNCELDPEVYKTVFGRDYRNDLGEENSIKVNRDDYGGYWASMELAEEYGVPLEIRDPHTSGMIHEVYNLSSETKAFDEKDDIARVAGRIIERSAHKDDFLKGFGSIERVADYLYDLRSRGGVQVIYMADNKLDFADFIRGHRHVGVDDRAVQIFSAIPDRFIGALVPVGKYEKERLGRLV